MEAIKKANKKEQIEKAVSVDGFYMALKKMESKKEIFDMRIKEGAQYLKSHYDYISEIDGVILLTSMGIGINLEMAEKAWELAFPEDC